LITSKLLGIKGYTLDADIRMAMRVLKSPFRFDLRSLIGDARRKLSNCVDGVTINLPFVSFNVKPDDIEQKVAREIVICMADRRVLNAFECCDN